MAAMNVTLCNVFSVKYYTIYFIWAVFQNQEKQSLKKQSRASHFMRRLC